jgi:DNA-directed RNA polymerase subunit L
MIKIIKSSDPNMKQDYLESAIGAYYDINHQLEGELNQSKASQFKRTKHMEDQVNEILEKTNNELRDLLKNIKKGFRSTMDT